MPFTGELGSASSQLGSVVLGGLGPTSRLPFGFTPHVLDPWTVRVLFNSEVDDSALNPAAYSMLAVSGPVPNFIPTVVSVVFYDSDQRSVALTLSQPMTYTTVYALSIVGVRSPAGNWVTPAAGNFRANVPSPALALYAFQSQRNMIDIYFDRSVGPTAEFSMATIEATTGGTPQPLTRIPWSGTGLPNNVLRFQLNPAMDSASSYTITFSNIVDYSYNISSGQVPLTLALRAPQPYSYSVLMLPQIVDVWVDSISNAPSGYGRARINVYFNCPMYGPDITNIANWTVTSNGSPVTVLRVNNWCSASEGLAFLATDARTYLAQLEVSASTATVPYSIQVMARSEDQAYSTNSADYTGSIPIVALATLPRVVGNSTTPSSANIRYNQGISLPNTTQVVGPTGPVRVPSVSVTASVQALTLMINDLMQSYNQHITTPYGAGHTVPDVINYFLPTEFPLASLSAAIAAVNRFRDIYWDHARSTVYHHYADPNLITTPYATDMPSAVTLVQALSASFQAHNINVGVHTSAGVPLFSAKLLDTLSIGFGMTNLALYQASGMSQYFYIDIGESSVPSRFNVMAQFIGSAYLPYVASAIPQIGLVHTNNGLRFEKDAVLVFFSKPIQPAALTPLNIPITGPSELFIQGTGWVTSRELSVAVIGMETAQYSVDVLGVQDTSGNDIVSA